ncbi:MAG: 5'-3' exonuclease H3TH domain-containing protein [Patescibacteria group bacterium]
MKELLLIDTHALVHRFFHALPPLTARDGSPAQALFGVSRVLLSILLKEQPDYVAAALDRPETTIRKTQFAEYKAHRAPTADALISQIKQIPELLKTFRVPTFSMAGYEADDVIGTLATRFSSAPDLRIAILSGDLDLLQLVRDDHVVVHILKSGLENTMLYNEPAVRTRYELNPQQLIDYKGLVGDTSDNIPGVPGIGPKNAKDLLREFGTLEEIFENLPLIKSTISTKLSEARDQAFLSRNLATIETKMPIPACELSELARKPIPKKDLMAYFEKLGFQSLIKQIENIT